MYSQLTRQLQEAGYKITPQRLALIEILLKTEHPLTALELFMKVKRKVPTISQDTVYRNLELLSTLKAVNRIRTRGGDRFELKRHHHHHFVCLGCGEVTCLKGCVIGPPQLAEAQKNGFKVMHHSFELSGYCVSCQESPKERKE